LSVQRDSRPQPDPSLPEAVIHERGRWRSLVDSGALPIWLLALLSLAIAVGALVTSQTNKGPEITVRFRAGHGIKAGDAVRHRGIDVGEVTAVALSEDFQSVDVRVQLEPHAKEIARESSRFWIQRPRISLSQVSGLETVVGAKYVGVWPGRSDAPPAKSFVGIETPPTLSGDEDVQISVRFKNGFGITDGSPVKHRGILVGEVMSVDLDDDLQQVVASVRLVQNGKRFAKGGTQFWVERPKLSLMGVSGLETIVGGRYLAVQPGPSNSEECLEFVGLDVPPVTLQVEDEGIEFILHASTRQSLERGAPVTYRGFSVGRILSVGLASDARRVEARLFVRESFTHLLRSNSKFWSTGGVDFSVGFTGINLNVEPLATVAAGGVAFATPEPPGEMIHTGHRYALLDEPPSDWLEWAPRIAVGSPLLQPGNELPRLQRCSVSWKARRLGISRTRRRSGWLLPLDDGQWVVPAHLIQIPTNAVKDSARIEVAGVQIPMSDIEQARFDPDHKAVVVSLTAAGEAEIARWPIELIRPFNGSEDLVLYTGPQEPQMIVPPDRIGRESSGWVVDPSIPLDDEWNGAAAIARSDARLVGLLTVGDGRAWIVPLSPLLAAEREPLTSVE
jgi:paraquat-inducible protein B